MITAVSGPGAPESLRDHGGPQDPPSTAGDS